MAPYPLCYETCSKIHTVSKGKISAELNLFYMKIKYPHVWLFNEKYYFFYKKPLSDGIHRGGSVRGVFVGEIMVQEPITIAWIKFSVSVVTF